MQALIGFRQNYLGYVINKQMFVLVIFAGRRRRSFNAIDRRAFIGAFCPRVMLRVIVCVCKLGDFPAIFLSGK